MGKKKEISYHQFAEDIVNLHGVLVQVREKFNDAVKEFRELQDMNKYIQEACKFQTIPFDCGDEDHSIASINLSDESFVMELAKILHDKSGLERCDLMRKLIERILKELKSFRAKVAKLDGSIKLLPHETPEERNEYNAQVNARVRSLKAIANREGKLEFVIRKYLRQRRANAMRQLGIDELLYATLTDNGERIHPDRFKSVDLYSVFSSIKANDTKVMKGIV